MDYRYCDICQNVTPQVFCPEAGEYVCSLCHDAYPDEYHG